MRYLAADDVILDRELFPHDIRATRAHVNALARIGAFTQDEADRVGAQLETLLARFADGAFVLDERYEDGHSAIEAHLTEHLGDLGKRIHLGRSRNDQALVAIRLCMRESLEAARRSALEIAEAALEVAREHEMTPMPGYTHLQRAVPSTVGLWMASYAEAFLDDAELIDMTARWIDRCPLGTAAGYGVNLPLDREGAARELGFPRLQRNPMAAQASRGKHETQALACLWQPMQTLRRLGWDLTLFATSEFGFVEMPPEMTTGSSIMPNKRNPDLAELLRGAAAVVAGAMTEIQQIVSLPSGYHRDLQLTKGPLLRAMRCARESLALAPALIRGLRLNTGKMRAAIDAPMHSTDAAIETALSGVSFRDAYRAMADRGAPGGARTPESSAAARVSPGACADLGLAALRARLEELRESSDASVQRSVD
ncbi:MAG: argininosuccinate lyase [Phycisphaeraceae bacterium]|nr:argininosuccinate lyase [Phycisphaeraceae bacterium]MCB9848656.1 argininosuccinate lyase [Phycisphaeraceae bacterium]